MSLDPEPSPYPEVDEKAAELIEEFEEHLRKFNELNHSNISKTDAFGGWAIQKIASMQLVILDFAERINFLEEIVSELHDKVD